MGRSEHRRRPKHKHKRERRHHERKHKRKRDWIQKAVKHKGALRKWVERNKAKIARITHEKPIKKDGDININALKKLKHSKEWDRLSTTTKRRIDLAITLNKLRKRK